MAFAPSTDEAVKAVLEKSSWMVTGWKVMSELPNPMNFDAASATVREEDILKQFPCGPELEQYLEFIGTHADAGFDQLVLMNAGPDPDAFLDFFSNQLRPRIA